MSEKSKKRVGRPRVVSADYNLLAEINDINNIPEITIKILKAFGNGFITLYSTKEMLNLLKTANSIGFSSLTKDMKEKYRIISEVSDKIRMQNLPALKSIEVEDEVDEDE
jgi:hypothetical protein